MNDAAPVLLRRGRSRWRSLVRRLLRIRDVEHAHSPGADTGIPGYRRKPGHGPGLDVLGDGTGIIKAAPQWRPSRIASEQMTDGAVFAPARSAVRARGRTNPTLHGVVFDIFESRP